MIDDLKRDFSVLEVDGIKQKVLQKIEEFKKRLKREKFLNDPFYENRKTLKSRKKSLDEGSFFVEDLQKDVEGYDELARLSKNVVDLNFFKKELQKLQERGLKKREVKKSLAVEHDKQIQKDVKLNRKLLQDKWQKDLDIAYKEWEREFEEQKQKPFLDDLKGWLKKLQKVHDTLKSVNLGNGMLFSFEKGELNEQDIKEVLKWAEFIEGNKRVKELCDLLGRLKKASKLKKRELAKSVREIKTHIKVTTSKNEISGIKLDDKIEYALPFELSLLSDDEMSLLFDKKFVEKSLLCFDSKRIGEIDKEITKKEEFEEWVEKEEEEKLGPIVLCVDTSGSMSGEPENIAKAVTLSIASIAKEQKRECFLINFSTGIEIFDFSKELGIGELVSFLKKSFHGGTDVAPALEYAVKKLQEDRFKNGDLLVISDFQAPDVGSDLKAKIKLAKEKRNRFYSLVIGNYSSNAINKIFDKEWIYRPGFSDITLLEDISEGIL